MAHFSKREDRSVLPGSKRPPTGGGSQPRSRGATEGPDEFAAPSPARAPGASAAPGSRSGPARHDEVRLCGLAAVRARFARDPASIQRLFFDYATGRQVGVMSKALAQAKKIYRCVEPEELEKIAGTVHHGGIVAVAAARPLRAVTATEVRAWARRGESLLILDRIGNPHNLGAIARSAAFFNVGHVIVPEDAAAAKPNDAAYRVAEGGLEHVQVWTSENLPALARDLVANGYDVIGAATRGGRPEMAPRARGTKPVALVLGNEEQGLAPEIATACARLVTIPGSGHVESLNVSVAAAVLMWEFFARKH